MNKEKYRITVNSTEINLDKEALENENIVSLPKGGISLLSGHRSFRSTVLGVDRGQKMVTLQMEGKIYEAHIETALDVQLKTMGFGSTSSKILKEIKAPMPGMVLEINVQEGDSVDAGTKLLVLEAMKMENVISIPAAGKIKKILVNKGEAVQKNQVLIELGNDEG
ncbi:MAG: acetyl-CoA carboxylase biotin carboxyl carrier protein subunit [Chitinophagaceae bacterium]|nr:MAG: acetyl-CoA carboxylase biotin carboxyl carrier protein subunit [Chitinophagaceae bacterium]